MTTLNYSSFDFDTVKTDLVNILQDDPVFNDYNFAGSNINTIVELIAGVSDLFNFYINASADESFISSAELYKNVNKLVELIGYNPGGYKSATITVGLQSTIDFPETNDYFEIPKWTEFTVQSVSPKGEEIRFVNPSALSYSGVQGIVAYDEEIYLIQGTRDSEPFTGTGDSFQKIELSDEKATETYTEITVDGVKWNKVDNLYRDIDSNSTVFTTRLNKNQKVELNFGDGIFGVKPPLNSEIIVTYIKTLGVDGQIGINEIDAIDADIHIKEAATGDDYETLIDFVIVQDAASDGGQDPNTTEEVRSYGPKFFRTQDRAVSQSDHEDLLLSQFSEFIYQSITLNSDEFFTMTGESPATSGNYYNNVYLYVLPKFGNTITGNLKQEIINFLADYKMATINYEINNLDFVNVDVGVTFKKTPETIRTQGEVTNDIDALIRDYFKRSNRSVGEELKFSEIMDSLHNIEGMSSLTLALSADTGVGWKYENIALEPIEFPELSNLTTTYNGIG